MAATCFLVPNQTQTKTLFISYRLLYNNLLACVSTRDPKTDFITIDHFKALKLLNQSNGERKLVL